MIINEMSEYSYIAKRKANPKLYHDTGSWFKTASKINSKLFEDNDDGYWYWREAVLDIKAYISDKENEKIKALGIKIITEFLTVLHKKYPKDTDNIELLKYGLSNSGVFGIRGGSFYDYEKDLDDVIKRVCPSELKALRMSDGMGNWSMIFVNRKNQISHFYIDFDHETREINVVKQIPTKRIPEKQTNISKEEKAKLKRRAEIGQTISVISIGAIILSLPFAFAGSIAGSIILFLGFSGSYLASYLQQETFEFNANEHFELLN